MRCYLDTSAAAKLIVEEAESAALASALDAGDVEPVATHLLETELRRLARRLDLPQAAVTAVLDRVTLYELPASAYREAGLLPGPALRSSDALHLVAAMRARADVVMTYDERMARAALDLGLSVEAP